VASVAGRILLIEGKRADYPNFYAGLSRKGYEVELVPNGNTALKRLEHLEPHLVLVNAPSMRTSGRRICQSIGNTNGKLPIVLIADSDVKNEDSLEARIILKLPFTLQKLLNRIRLLVPTEEQDLLIRGPIKLDAENRWVRCEDRHTSLTPRLVSLLKALMDRPGEVFGREELFRLVWETEYTGDTRTLDVHISWLRQAIEEDPRRPKYIKTVRGVGYRLDVDAKGLPARRRSIKKK
jgi:DNA-binding response OmpR family regulator